jgi:large repetitive protein
MNRHRFAFIFTLLALIAGISATSGSTASFDDTTPCPADGALLVCPAAQVGQPYSLQLRALAGCDIYRWEITNGGLPAGLSLSSSGAISGTPTASGQTTPWITVHDLLPSEGGNSWCGGDNHSERQFVFSASPGLSIQNQSVPGGTIGQSYSVTFTALSLTNTNPVQGSPASATWSIQSGSLPAGVTLSSAGVLSGTPTTEGSYTFVVRAVGGGGASDTETETLTVRQPLTVSTPLNARAQASKSEVGVPFTATLTAAGGSGTYTWAVTSGTLPSGVTLDPNGTVSGTPIEAGRFTFVSKATDSEGRSANASSTIVVAAKLRLGPQRLPLAKAGKAYRARIVVTGGAAPKTFSLRGKLPRGVSFGKKLGILLGKPTTAGSYRFTVTAVDALGVSASRAVTLVVR